MSGFSRLPRLVKLYQMLEKMRARELSTASLAVDEVHRLAEKADQGRLEDDSAARTGLASGSWIEASATLAGQQTAKVQRCALQNLQILRTKDRLVAKGLHQASFTELRQVETLLTSARKAAAQLEERASQSASDDRYLSRREWMRKRTADQLK